ncbi:SGNH/GDSL hydrolase family protein [Kribbella sp. NPDC050459]|uniref:SGNH/GDSL hydrolase family protein n=1 Tax=Kribbella sp. NPDC050459 TaxID=3155785 RepID=UPI0033D933DC
MLTELQWLDPLSEPFRVSGFGWRPTEWPLRRLPRGRTVRPDVDDLANHAAGGQVRFITDSSAVAIKGRLSGPPQLDHMARTGECGFDCYVAERGPARYHATGREVLDSVEFSYELFTAATSVRREFTINLPLYQGVAELWIGLDPTAEVLAPLGYAGDQRVIVYGTSITQGGCATRPGMAYTNILSRRLPYEVVNLGFSGNGLGKPEVAELVAEIERPGCYVLDYDANVRTTEALGDSLAGFVHALHERHPGTPVVVLSRPQRSTEHYDSQLRSRREEGERVIDTIVSRLRSTGRENVHSFRGSELYGVDFPELTVDGVHPSDAGFLRIANALAPILSGFMTSGGLRE